MALTIGQSAGLFGDLGGDYASGAFVHTFAERPLMASSEADEAELVQAWVQTGVPLRTALRRVGWDDTDIVTMDADRQIETLAQRSMSEAMIAAAERDFDQGLVT